MKELKSIKVYTPLSKYLAWFVFFGGANICLIGALFYNYIFGRVRNPLSLIGLIVSFTIFTAIQVAIKYLFGRKLLIEGQDIRAKKWYGKWHKFALTINCKNSPSSVGGEMNCNKIKKNTCSGLGNVL